MAALSVNGVHTKGDFSDFVRALVLDLEENPGDWENVSLQSFLVAMAAWVDDMDQYYVNTGQVVPASPNWKTFAEILCAAKNYE
ncbi:MULTISPECIES: DUF7660 family protein [Cupriavidus]|uniref:DUF7660 family protein n=1 Tax=Cupriavidus TaxID=106589 RepID=UPI000F951CA8|nr:hypothetical protein [Cupriavidus campinensis]